MKNILICNQKGGVGKSMIADELSFAFERDGIITNFYNLDPQGGTLHPNKEIASAQVGIVDTPGALTAEFEYWLNLTDLVIIPTRPTSRDIPTLFRMREILSKRTIPVLYVINGANRWKASREFYEWIQKEFAGEKFVQLPQSEIFVRAALAEKSIVELGESPASQAVKNLYKEVKEILRIADG